MDSTPPRRFRQKSATDAAPGNRPAIPTTAMALGEGGFDEYPLLGVTVVV